MADFDKPDSTPPSEDSVDAGAPSDTPTPQAGNSDTQVNQQIIDAVSTSTAFVFGQDPASASQSDTDGSAAAKSNDSAATAIGYGKVAQATAYSVQDAIDYQRNVMSVSNAAQGKALALMFEDAAKKDADALVLHLIVYAASIAGSFAAGYTATEIGEKAGQILAAYENPPTSGR